MSTTLQLGDIYNPGSNIGIQDFNRLKSVYFADIPIYSLTRAEFDLSNVENIPNYSGPTIGGFVELKNVYFSVTNPQTIEYDSPFDLSDSAKGSQVDALINEFTATEPEATATVYFDGSNQSLEFGYCRVYERDVDDIEESTEVEPPIELLKGRSFTSLEFGLRSVALHGDYVAVSALYDDNVGVAFVYKRGDVPSGDSTKFRLNHEVTVTNTSKAPIVELNEEFLFIGNPLAQEVTIYKLADLPMADMSESLDIEPLVTHTSINSELEFYGSDLTATDDHLFIGVENGIIELEDDELPCGYVDVYKLSGGDVWSFWERLSPHDLEELEDDVANYGESVADLRFGFSVMSYGDYLLVGSPRSYKTTKDRREGAVYVYKVNSIGKWVFAYKLEYDDTLLGSAGQTGSFEFGRSAVIDFDDTIWVVSNPLGGTYVSTHDANGNVWQSSTAFKISDDRVGGSLAVGIEDVDEVSAVVFGAGDGNHFTGWINESGTGPLDDESTPPTTEPPSGFESLIAKEESPTREESPPSSPRPMILTPTGLQDVDDEVEPTSQEKPSKDTPIFAIKFDNTVNLSGFSETHHPQSEYSVSDECVLYGVSYDGDTENIKIHGNGYDGIAWADLVLIRGNEYKFEFENRPSAIEVCELDGNPLKENVHPTGTRSLVIKPTGETPDELKYVMLKGDESSHGFIHVRDANKIMGRILGYGYLSHATIRLNETTDVESHENGIFTQYILQDGTPVVDSTIKSFDGVDSSVNDDCSFMHETPIGSLVLNCFTTVFSKVLEKMDNANVHLANNLIVRYFGLSESYNILNDDPLGKYIWSGGDYGDYARLVSFSLLVEYFTRVQGTSDADALMTEVATEILSNNSKLEYFNLTPSVVAWGGSSPFARLLSTVTIRIFDFNRFNTKETTLGHLYALIRLVRKSVFAGALSYSEFIEDYESKFEDSLKYISLPMLPKKVVLRAVEDGPVAPFGPVGVREVDGQLIRCAFGELRKFSYEVFLGLIGKVVRIGVTKDSFCYRIVDGLHFDDGSFHEIEYELLGGYEDEDICCKEERADRPRLNVEYGETDISEVEIGSLKLIEGGSSSIMLSSSITNKSHPIEDLGNNRYRVYIDEEVRNGLTQGSSPAYIGIAKDFAGNLDYRGIRLGYNTEESTREVKLVRHDYADVHVVTTWVGGKGVLNLVADRPHGLSDGDFISIRSSSKNGVLNGTHTVMSHTEATFSIKSYDLGEGDLTAITAVFESLHGSKIYCNSVGFEVRDMVVFDFAEGGKTYRIHELSADEYGGYFLVGGFVSRYVKQVIKSHSQTDDENLVEFNYDTHLNYYKVAGLNTRTESMWLSHEPDLYPRGRAGNILSFVEFFNKNMNNYS